MTKSENAHKPLPLRVKIAHGIGAAGFGIKENGFNYFLLLFYGQVVGMDQRLVGLALFIALTVDAVSDPLVGYWSDNTRSKWGRRHPFMYAAVLPVSISYFLLWNPPDGWSDQALFWYVLMIAVVIRTALTFYETPSSALTPELSTDYDERSSIMSYRIYFGWTIGVFMTVVMFFVLFPHFSTEAIPDGRFNPDSYQAYGIFASIMIFLTIMTSSLGTHNRIPLLLTPPARPDMTALKAVREMFETLSNRSFLALFSASFCGAIATGLSAGLTFYFLIYFWEFTTIQQGVIVLGTFLSAIIGFVLAPIITRKIGKKRGAVIIGFMAFVGAPMPVFLRLIGVLPENGSPELFIFVLIAMILDVGLIVCYQILFYSMLADLVEQSELQTGRRSEGVFSAAATFIRKMVQGFGVAGAASILAVADIAKGADPSQVSDESVFKLGLYYVPAILTVWMLMIFCISRYKLSRADHMENLRKLGEKSAP